MWFYLNDIVKSRWEIEASFVNRSQYAKAWRELTQEKEKTKKNKIKKERRHDESKLRKNKSEKIKMDTVMS